MSMPIARISLAISQACSSAARDSRGRIARIQLADARERRQAREAGTEALHGPAFLIDADEKRIGARDAKVIDQRRHLLAVFEVAREQDHAADLRRGEPVAVFLGEGLAGQADDQHSRTIDPGKP